jgi:hypothetical protein
LVLHHGAQLAQGPTGLTQRRAKALGQLPKRFAITDAPPLGHAIERRRRKELGVPGEGGRWCQGQWIDLLPHIPRDERDGRLHFGHDALGFLHALQAALAEPFVLGKHTTLLHGRLQISGQAWAVATYAALEIATRVVGADATAALGAVRALLRTALLLTPGRCALLLGLLQAHGRLWRVARPALCWLVTRRVQGHLHLIELRLRGEGGVGGGSLLRRPRRTDGLAEGRLHMEDLRPVVRRQRRGHPRPTGRALHHWSMAARGS